MNGRRQRLAWFILLASFFICVILAVAVPLTGSAWVQGATRPLTINVQANQGTVGLLSSAGAGAIFAGDPAQPLEPGGTILTNATDAAFVLFAQPAGEPIMVRTQVYGNTNVTVVDAAAPRFSTSAGTGSLVLDLTTGRILLTVLPQAEPWSTLVEVNTPQGLVTLAQPGQYSIIASNVDTQVAVFEGQAEISGPGGSLLIADDQRAVLPTSGTPEGPLDSERNLIANGDFNQGTVQWVELTQTNIELPDQPLVNVSISQEGEEQALTFLREGVGHADVGLRQLINQDVTDYESLRLGATMRIRSQSLGVCGRQGSECPLIIRIEYVDTNGVSQTWQQGFYAVGEIGPETPDICITCAPPYNEHLRIPFDQLVFYESENLLEQLALQNILPRQIKVITLVSSGHTFHAEVLDVALMAKE
jgi:hypothetical protein